MMEPVDKGERTPAAQTPDDRGWLTRGVGSVGLASFLSDFGHDRRAFGLERAGDNFGAVVPVNGRQRSTTCRERSSAERCASSSVSRRQVP